MFKVKNIILVTLGIGISVAQPTIQWWIDRGIVDPNQTYEWNAVTTIGQGLNFADKSISELDEKLAPIGGAGFTMDDILVSRTAEELIADPSFNPKEALVAGVAKNFSYRFLDRLYQIGYRSFPIENSTDSGIIYPWSNNGTGAENLELVVAAQLKNLFSWEISSDFAYGVDMDGDRIKDWYEYAYLGGLTSRNDASSDFDGDGIDLGRESELGTIHDFSDNPSNLSGTVYYVNNINGKDENDGLVSIQQISRNSGPKKSLDATVTAISSESTIIIQQTSNNYQISNTISPTANITIIPTDTITFTTN